jgi:hypothetical protein
VGELVVGAEGLGFLPLPPPRFFPPPLSRRREEAGIFLSAETADTTREKIKRLAAFILDGVERRLEMESIKERIRNCEPMERDQRTRPKSQNEKHSVAIVPNLHAE